ncbi:TPA: hypothetical protein ACUI23_000696 [Staphylococcus pseudintermedius]
MKYTYEKGISIDILTNGLLLSKRKNLYKYVDKFIISLDILISENNKRIGLEIDKLLSNLNNIPSEYKKIKFNQLIIYYNNKALSTAELVIKVLASNFDIFLIGEKTGSKDIVTTIMEYNKMYFKIPCFKYIIDNELDKHSYIPTNNLNLLLKEFSDVKYYITK